MGIQVQVVGHGDVQKRAKALLKAAVGVKLEPGEYVVVQSEGPEGSPLEEVTDLAEATLAAERASHRKPAAKTR